MGCHEGWFIGRCGDWRMGWHVGWNFGWEGSGSRGNHKRFIRWSFCRLGSRILCTSKNLFTILGDINMICAETISPTITTIGTSTTRVRRMGITVGKFSIMENQINCTSCFRNFEYKILGRIKFFAFTFISIPRYNIWLWTTAYEIAHAITAIRLKTTCKTNCIN